MPYGKGPGDSSSSTGGLSAEQVRDTVAAFVREGTDISIVHDDAANTLTISFSGTAGGGGGLTVEQVRDLVATFVRAAPGEGISVTHDDAGDSLTIGFTLPDGSVNPAKLDADTAAKETALREAIAAGRLEQVAAQTGTPLTFRATRADGGHEDVTVDGAADSAVGIEISGATLQLNKRDGSHEQRTLPSGGTDVVANPTGTGGDTLERLRVGTVDFVVPPQSADTFIIWWEENGRLGADQGNGRQWSLGNGAVAQPVYIPFDCTVVAMHLSVGHSGSDATADLLVPETTVKIETVDDTASTGLGGTDVSDLEVTLELNPNGYLHTAVFVPEDDAPIALSAGDLIRPYTAAPPLMTSSPQQSAAIATLVLRRTGTDTPEPAFHPHVSSFVSTSGDLAPAAGSIAGLSYGVSWGIAQSDHVGAARVIGFKGAFDPNAVSVLLTIAAGEYAHGTGEVVIPNGVSLADDETYTLRLQVFGEGVTAPTAGTATVSYQDIVITAHAPATANYHWGRLPYVAGRTAAQYAALINFNNNDLVTGPTLDTTNGYEAVPDTTGTWVFYLVATASEPQPTGWADHNGLPANGAFEPVVDRSYNSVASKVYIMSIQRQHSDGSQTYVPRTS